jgi:hypothetical protein
MDEQERLNNEIKAIEDIEKILAEYEAAKHEYDQVKAFEDMTHNDNEYLVKFIDDLETLLPYESHIVQLTANDGDVEFDLQSGWHDTTKNEVADVLLNIAALDYVSDFKIPAIEDAWRIIMIIDHDEDGNPIYWTKDYVAKGEEEEEEGEGEGEGEEDQLETIDGEDLENPKREPVPPVEYVEYETGLVLPEGIKEIEQVLQRQVTYTAKCHIGPPKTPEAENAEGGEAE